MELVLVSADKSTHLVLPNSLSFYFLCDVFDDLTGRYAITVRKLIDKAQYDLFLVLGKSLNGFRQKVGFRHLGASKLPS